jgi:hypothetical protein
VTDDEIIVRKTVIGGKRWRDDYTVICVHATTRPAFNSCGRYIVPGHEPDLLPWTVNKAPINGLIQE